MTEQRQSRRKAPRLKRSERVFVRIMASDRHPELSGTMARCTTSDLSAGGLRLTLDHPVTEGTRLDLWLKLPEHPGTFLLTGEVRWVADGPLEDQRVAGVALTDDPETQPNDHSDWQQVLDILSRRPAS